MSPGCCASLESVLLSFTVTNQSQVSNISWGNVERALSPARCPRLRTLHVGLKELDFVLAEHEVRERLPGLALGELANMVALTCE
jgi:hypothetical protein